MVYKLKDQARNYCVGIAWAKSIVQSLAQTRLLNSLAQKSNRKSNLISRRNFENETSKFPAGPKSKVETGSLFSQPFQYIWLLISKLRYCN